MPREILPAFPKTGADPRQLADPGTRAEWEPEWNELRRVGMRRGAKVSLINRRLAWESWWRENSVNQTLAARGGPMVRPEHEPCLPSD